MRRRRLLAGSLGLVPGGLAGCLTTVGSDGSAGTPARTTAAGSTATGATGSEPAGDGPGGDSGASDDGGPLEPQTGPEIAGTSFRPTGGGCGDGVDEASVTFDEDGVTVTGTISGRDACMLPRLASATYDPDADVLVVLVETHAEGELCAQCLVDLGYEATVRLDAGRPGSVVVRHGSRGEERAVVRATA